MLIQVPPSGLTSGPLLAIVGEAPTQEDERVGVAFCGSTGQFLNSVLQTAGVSRDQCYLTNVIKTRPPANDYGRFYEDARRNIPRANLAQAWEDLRTELRRVKPAIVVALGAEPLRALTGHRSIKQYRGTVIEAHGLRVLPTYHPSYVLRGMYEEKPVVECDLRKAKRQAIAPHTPTNIFNTNPTFHEVMHCLTQRPKRISLDLETTKNRTRLIGLAWSESHAMSIPMMRGSAHAWSESEEAEICLALDDLLRSDVEKVIQNQMYDSTVLGREYGFVVNNVVMDTMVAHHLLYPELPKGLDFLSSIYTDHPMYWGEGTNATYNCIDCTVTWEISNIFETMLKNRGMWDFYQRILQRGLEALLYIQSRGVLIDQPLRARLRERVVKEMDTYLTSLETSLGRAFNPSSPAQVKKLCYEEWKLPSQQRRTKEGMRVTTDDDALQALIKKAPQHAQTLQTILDYRQKRVLLGTFIDMELDQGRAVTSYNIAGTVTGRLSSSQTIDKLGGNLANIPRGDFRRVFIPDQGKLIIKADLSQAEYRILIWKARIHRVIDRWLNEPGFNIHRWNASENIYKVPLEQVTPAMYNNAKSGVYGANYGIQPPKVARMYNMELSVAKFILTNYHHAVPEVEGVYQKEIRDALHSTRTLRNPLGRERIFFGRMDDETYRAAYSHYAQSTVADLIDISLADLHDAAATRNELGLEILLQVHDELVFQCWEHKVEECVPLVRSLMERPMVFEGVKEPLVIPCEIKVGRNWYDTMDLAKWKEQQCLIS